MVVRKLEQDVEGFWDFLRGEAEGDAVTSMDWLAAKIVGRWRDGTPLVRSPEGPDGDGAARDALNDFTYGADPERIPLPDRCPHQENEPARLARLEWRSRTGIGSSGADALHPGRRSREAGLIFVCFKRASSGSSSSCSRSGWETATRSVLARTPTSSPDRRRGR